jgi:hypothetical protein
MTPAASYRPVADLHLIWCGDGLLGSTELPQPAKALSQCRRDTQMGVSADFSTDISASADVEGTPLRERGLIAKREMKQRRR